MTYSLKCIDCGYKFKEDRFYNECPKCNGILEAVIDDVGNAAPDERYDTIMKWHPFLPIDDPHSLARYENARPTPIINAPNLAKKYGFAKLLLKDETVMESETMKDREGLLTINRLLINNIPGLVLASSGNAGISIAWYGAKVGGPKIYLYLPECSRARMEALLARLTTPDVVTVVYVEGSTDEAGAAGREFAKANNLPFGTGFNNYSRREGIKTFALEYLLEQKERAHWYVQGVAGALAIYAFHKAHRELGVKCPRLAGVQPDACAPFVDAWQDGAKTLEEKYIPPKPVVVPEAPVLKSRKPIGAYPLIKGIVDETDGYFEKVSADEIKNALGAFYLEGYFVDKYSQTGVRPGCEAATALAGIIKMRQNNVVKAGDTVLVNVSGAARPGDIIPAWWDDIRAEYPALAVGK